MELVPYSPLENFAPIALLHLMLSRFTRLGKRFAIYRTTPWHLCGLRSPFSGDSPSFPFLRFLHFEEPIVISFMQSTWCGYSALDSTGTYQTLLDHPAERTATLWRPPKSGYSRSAITARSSAMYDSTNCPSGFADVYLGKRFSPGRANAVAVAHRCTAPSCRLHAATAVRPRWDDSPPCTSPLPARGETWH